MLAPLFSRTVRSRAGQYWFSGDSLLWVGLALVMMQWSWSSQGALAQGKKDGGFEKKKQRIVFADDQSKPIEGVHFRPFGLNSSYFWPKDLLGEPPEYVSDADGTIEVEYPVQFIGGTVTCNSIDGLASHPAHVSLVARVKVLTGAASPVTLQRGLKLALQGINEVGDVLPQYTALMSSDQAPTNWVRRNDGFIESNAISLGHFQLMLVAPQANGKTCFSDCLIYQFTSDHLEEGVTMENIDVTPGLRLEGKLEEKVVRPVKNGRVIAYCAPLPIERGETDFLVWNDWADIREDGTFAFESLPRTGKVQLIALCDGWVGTFTHAAVGEFIDLEQEESQVVLPMHPTLQAVVKVVDPEGKPIPDAMVGFSPNQVIWNKASTLLGFRSRTLDHVQGLLNPGQAVATNELDFSRYSAKTDAQGVARVPNLLPRTQSYSVAKKGKESFTDTILEVPVSNELPAPNFEVSATVQLR